MGAVTNQILEDFAQRTGIHPASGDWGASLEHLSEMAFNLIKVIELERCGVRDGDGAWHGSDPLDWYIRQIEEWGKQRRYGDDMDMPPPVRGFRDDSKAQ